MGRKQPPPRGRGAKRQGIAAQALRGGKSQIGQQNRTAPKKIVGKQQNAQKLQQKREQLRSQQVGRNRGVISGSLAELAGRAAQSSQQFEHNQTQQTQNQTQDELVINDASRRAYMKELRKVVDKADVILEVLDARDPMGCRTLDMEDAIGNRHGKKLVLVLNKVDLVPPHVLQPWLKYLRGFYPTVAFKASTQNQSKHLSANFGRADKAAGEAVSGSKAVGTDALMQLLKNYCRSHGVKTAITVGVIGYPNVGKSSVINSLKRSKAASVSSTAGHTKVMQEVHIDSKIKLLDCPGIVFDHSDSSALLLRNCINTESMADPVGAVQVLLTRCQPEQLAELYQLPVDTVSKCFQDAVQFLVLVAQSKGKLGKGGIPDRQAAARIVLQDWNRGKLPYFTPPPDQSVQVLDTQLVTSFGQEFNVADEDLNPTSIFLPDADASKGAISGPQCSIPVASTSSGDVTMGPDATATEPLPASARMSQMLGDSDSDSDSDMESDTEMVDDGADFTFPQAALSTQELAAKLAQDALNPQTALAARRKAKQWRKLKRRAARQQLGSEAENLFSEQFGNIVGIAPPTFASPFTTQ
ncbi:guanine nucleotide-binding protein-like 3 [Phytophthora infestans T30-4]|uniref:Guanine nucleotide-binding protein-like 3 n=1 Tax=Phytophthora infestans (strain T30-4) TaxID=403677 RepID=D0NLU6_PHYIT|nr:guanine nucleotide-binding protein-like 3 [Phytophthora infestans T30-4]EEY60643.1 guanine nucleotide-binding protein-like 3 [Phytophthora infestans T30-4]|eukprot:XP_002900016.1 guanine nucleotide-binding protein-like 3 [Phytophthora infestans T30-4]